MLVAECKERGEGSILRMKGELTGSSVIQLGTFLREAAKNHTAHLTLDFGQILRFEHTGVALSVAILEFYARDFSKITCRRFPRTIARVLKGFGIKKIPNVEIVAQRRMFVANKIIRSSLKLN